MNNDRSSGTFIAALERRVLLCDGAMGTMLHAAGNALDRALPDINLSDPALVGTIHDSYVTAGADIIQTNTFGACRLRLADLGSADRTEEINRAGVRIAAAARQRASREVFVAGSVSPAVTARRRHRTTAAERRETLGEQIRLLADEGIDLLVLETFGYLDELVEAIEVAGEVTGLPIVAQAMFTADGHTLGGETPHDVATALWDAPIAVLGTNCTLGPQRMLGVVEDLVAHSPFPVSAQPNAGQPRRAGDGRFEFNIDGSYLARYLRRFAEAGVRLVGGCCGTTPTHIAAAEAELRDMPPAPVRTAELPSTGGVPAAEAEPKFEGFAERLARRRFVVAVGISPPVGGDVDEAMDTMTALGARGIEFVAVTPQESVRAQLGLVPLALHLQQHAGVEAIATVTTWDKTIMTLQADLLGAHALGMRAVICETGRPPILGDYQVGDGVWEVDSIGLIKLLAGLNQGRDSSGLALATKTSFCIGARINPSADDLDAEIDRARAKTRAGAQFFVTRPVYEADGLVRLTDALAADEVCAGMPVLASISAISGFDEADYLAHEVPDIRLPDATLRAMEQAGPRAAAVGRDLAVELIKRLRSRVAGVVLGARDDATAIDPLLAAVR